MGQVLNNISSSNIFQNMLLSERYHQNSQAVLAVVSFNGLSTPSSNIYIFGELCSKFLDHVCITNIPFMPRDLLDQCRLDLLYL